MGNFEKNLHIIYTDESSDFSHSLCSSYSMSSIVAPQKYYIDRIECDWNKLKKKYNIANGICLHFTDIKALLNPRYYSRSVEKRNVEMEKIFCDDHNNLKYDLLYNFYSDIIKFIDTHDFKVIVSNVYDYKSKQMNSNLKKYTNSIWYILFKNHLDEIAEYSLREKYSNSQLKFIAKIRYDGDLGLSNKNDIRDAFSNSITTGTNRFTSEIIRNCFDELRFINKKEVGFCSNCKSIPSCTNKNYSHAGNEIIDFIAAYSGKHLTKDVNIDMFKQSFPDKKDRAEISYQHSTTIKINDKLITPLDVIIPKIYTEL